MTLCEQITDYVNAAFTGLWVQTQEPDEAEREIIRLAQQHKWRLAVWDIAGGLRVPAANSGSAGESAAGDPLAALRALPSLAEPQGTAVLLLHNFHRFLNNPLCGSPHKGFYVTRPVMCRSPAEPMFYRA
jgi:hypothetical protein